MAIQRARAWIMAISLMGTGEPSPHTPTCLAGRTPMERPGCHLDECLNVHWFETLDQARATIESWRTDYNEQRPHSALGNVPPAAYVANLEKWAVLLGSETD